MSKYVDGWRTIPVNNEAGVRPKHAEHQQSSRNNGEVEMSKLPRNLMVGNRVTVLKDIDLQPYTIVKAGERGTVVGVEDFIDVMMDTPHHGLDANVAWIEHDASGYIAAIRPPGPRWVPRLAAAVCVGFLFAGMVEVALARTLNIPSTVETLLLQGD